MSRLIARILLAILLLPLAALMYVDTFFMLLEGMRNRGIYTSEAEAYGCIITGILTWAFMATYWVLLWVRGVGWRGRRRVMTLWAAVGAMAVAGVIGVLAGGVVAPTFGWFVASVAAPLLWMIGTVLAWRENAEERAARLANSGRDAVVCPTCG